MTQPILVFGAAGKFAQAVVPALKARGARVRAFVRHSDDRAHVEAAGADEVAMGDLTDSASVRAALKGVTRLFYIAPAFMKDEAQVGEEVVRLAADAGVERFVFSSVIHPVLASLPNHAAKAPVEQALIDSGMAYTLLHPALYFQNYLAAWDTVRRDGVLSEPWSCATRFSRVDYRDVAEAAAIALVQDRLLWGTFELCAEGWHNRYDVARLMAAALGRPVSAERRDPDTLGAEAAPMRPMFDHYDHVGLLGNALTLRAILGREPRTLATFFAELAASPGGV